MTLAIATCLRTVTHRVTPRRWHAATEALRRIVKELFDPYRPERHYMRGPGPKWHAKHSHAYATVRRHDGKLARARG